MKLIFLNQNHQKHLIANLLETWRKFFKVIVYIFFSKILGSQFYNDSSATICTSIESSAVHVVAHLWWYDSSISN